MSLETSQRKYDRQTVLNDLVAILKDMTSDWDMAFDGAIEPQTRLIADLSFESIDVVQLVVAIEEHFQRRDLPFVQLLMKDGHYVDDLQVGDAVDFLVKHLNA